MEEFQGFPFHPSPVSVSSVLPSALVKWFSELPVPRSPFLSPRQVQHRGTQVMDAEHDAVGCM